MILFRHATRYSYRHNSPSPDIQIRWLFLHRLWLVVDAPNDVENSDTSSHFFFSFFFFWDFYSWIFELYLFLVSVIWISIKCHRMKKKRSREKHQRQCHNNIDSNEIEHLKINPETRKSKILINFHLKIQNCKWNTGKKMIWKTTNQNFDLKKTKF